MYNEKEIEYIFKLLNPKNTFIKDNYSLMYSIIKDKSNKNYYLKSRFTTILKHYGVHYTTKNTKEEVFNKYLVLVESFCDKKLLGVKKEIRCLN